ncbi:MAG TPA: VCBS repeat-containing protein, partial [Acidimicrobiia bacterium]|nr:VCBS repeat-containing protein [Acidimicrobiia bacterium]
MLRTRIFTASALAVAVVATSLPFVATATPAAAIGGAQWSKSFSGWNRSSSPTIADVTGDGVPEIIHGAQDGWVRVLNAATGDNIPGWPQPEVIRPGYITPVDGSPSVGDLDNDGAPEIVVPGGSTWRKAPGGVVVFRRDGSVKCSFETAGWSGNNDQGVYSTPALGDVDGDGFRDIVFGGWDLRVHALNRDCNELSGFPVNVEDSTWSSPALYDSDGDGRLEIFIGSDQMAGGAIDWSGGEFRALDWRNGSVVELWKRRINDVFHSSPAIGDIDGDGSMEVVTGGGNYYNRDEGRKIFAFNIHDGSDQGGFPVLTGAQTNSSPAIGDVNNDGVADVVAGSNDGYVRAINGHGQQLWASGLRFVNSTPGGPVASPIIADMNGDGVNDVGVANNFAFFVLNGSNGAEMAAVNTFVSYESAGAVGDFGPLGWKLIVSGFDTPQNFTRIESYAIPTPGKTPPWPMFHKNAGHTGAPLPTDVCRPPSNPAPHPSSASANGYWVLSSVGGVYSLGAPFY